MLEHVRYSTWEYGSQVKAKLTTQSKAFYFTRMPSEQNYITRTFIPFDFWYLLDPQMHMSNTLDRQFFVRNQICKYNSQFKLKRDINSATSSIRVNREHFEVILYLAVIRWDKFAKGMFISLGYHLGTNQFVT